MTRRCINLYQPTNEALCIAIQLQLSSKIEASSRSFLQSISLRYCRPHIAATKIAGWHTSGGSPVPLGFTSEQFSDACDSALVLYLILSLTTTATITTTTTTTTPATATDAASTATAQATSSTTTLRSRIGSWGILRYVHISVYLYI